MLECSPLYAGRVAQRQSSGLLSRWLRVRISPRSQKTPEKQGFFHGKMNEPNLKYALGMPITIARFVQTEQCGWAKYALFGWNGRRNKELKGSSNSPKAVDSIKRAERSYQQYFQLPLLSVLLASA